MSALRGQIVHDDRAKQLVDYSGLRYNKITPQDLDGFQVDDNEPHRIRGIVDFNGKCFVIYEFKYGDKDMELGQRLDLEFLTNALAVPSLVVVARHNTRPHEVIDAASCEVVEIRLDGEWRPPSHRLNVREITDKFKDSVDKGRHEARKLAKPKPLEPCRCRTCWPTWQAFGYV